MRKSTRTHWWIGRHADTGAVITQLFKTKAEVLSHIKWTRYGKLPKAWEARKVVLV